MSTSPCEQTIDRLAEILDVDLVSQDLLTLRRHVAECAPCEALVAEQRRLVAELRTLVPVPTGAFPSELRAPSLEPARAGSTDGSRAARSLPHDGGLRFRGSRWLQLAAAALFLVSITVAAVVWTDASPRLPAASQAAGSGRSTGVPVVIESISSERVGMGVPDEELLHLTSGWDAVASLRPALDQ